jgi:hypothetical protein
MLPSILQAMKCARKWRKPAKDLRGGDNAAAAAAAAADAGAAAASAAPDDEEDEEDEEEEDEEDEDVPLDGRIFPKFNLKRLHGIRDDCFYHDWQFISTCEFLNIAECEKEKVANALRNKYLWVLPLFRRLATQDTEVGGTTADGVCRFGVSLLSAGHLMGKDPKQGIDIIDKNLTKAKVEQQYKEANYVRPEIHEKLLCISDKRLSRYQFVEFLLRIAVCKYPSESLCDAVRLLFVKLERLCDRYSGDVMNLWTIGSTDLVEDMYQKIRPRTMATFSKLALGGDAQVRRMNLTDWSKMLEKSEVYTLYQAFRRRDSPYSFRLGLHQAVDEQYDSSWQQMSYLEFQRGIGAMLFLTQWHEHGACSAEKLGSLLKSFVDHLVDTFDVSARDMATARQSVAAIPNRGGVGRKTVQGRPRFQTS